ncbi:hypothetical protein BDV26DRAFT_277092 [Aspergillus bertholletiae]|uniref:Uncharacterized protein n=1 Tax=Aspergillus bertholletiae TaxID=1226010 RepID=A0A5N7BPU2_9EURO|nr:hypothetical protein BDV26DRAFT_277092 [Aspergillus bertholletiae]
MGTDNFTELCIECDLWYNDLGKWARHGKEYLSDSYKLLCCDPIIFRNAPVKAGLRPFCLGDEIIGPWKHMTQYLDCSEWYRYVQSYLSYKALSGMFHCRYPACQEDFEGLTDLEYYLCDVHCYNPPRGKKRAMYSSYTER